jgi:PadR family transcriptional regulator AphA
MPDPSERPLSLREWVVLCVVCEGPTHGFALGKLFPRDGSLGRVWQVPRLAIYGALRRLERRGLVQWAGEQRTNLGPDRSLVTATRAGRREAKAWLRTPVAHGRDVRSELLMKLALLDRAGADPRELLRDQRAQFAPLATVLADRVQAASGMEHALALWRHETMSATMQLLDEAAGQAEPASTPELGRRPRSCV